MKRERFRDKWKKFKKKDPYDRKSRPFGDRRSGSFERGYDHKNDNDFYKRSSDRNYPDFDENPRFKRKDPYKTKFKRPNHTYTEYKSNSSNSSNSYSKYDSHDTFDMPTNSSKSASYQHKSRDHKRNRNDEYSNAKVSSKYIKTKPSETKLLNGSDKKQTYIRSSENSQKKKDSIDKSSKSYSKSKPNIHFDKHKRDTKPSESVSSSSKKGSTHSDRSKAHKSEASKSSSSSVSKPSSSSSSKSIVSNSKSSSSSTKIKSSKSNVESSKHSYDTHKSKESGSNIIISKPSGLTIKINKPSMGVKPEPDHSRYRDDYTPSGKRKRPKKHYSEEGDTLTESEVDRKVHCKHSDSFKKPSSRKSSEAVESRHESRRGAESSKKESSHTRKSSDSSHTHRHASAPKPTARNSTSSSVRDYTEDSEEYPMPSSTDLSVKNCESLELKKESHSKKEVKKKVMKKTKMVSDIINLNKKITRNTQSFYESQLKLAIEMSIRDCNSSTETARIENDTRESEDKEDEIKQEEEEYEESAESQAEENEHDSISESSSESDSDSDYAEHKPRRRSQKSSQKVIPDKKSKSGKSTPTNKKLIKPKKKPEDGTVSTTTTTTSSTANNTSTNLTNLNVNGAVKAPSSPSAPKEISTPTSEPTNKEKVATSDSSLLSGVNKSKSVDQESLNDQLLMETKMRAFEEYLSMSERLYCGKTLVDDYILCTYNGSTNGTNGSLSSHNSSETLKTRESDSSTSFGGSTEDAPPKDHKLNGKEEKLFRFNCSKLDLLYRVSFNILKSSLRQPQVIDLWGPKELVLFELGLFKYGKEFHEIQRDIPSKSVKEIVDMYYLWKKSSRYKLWKANRYY